MYSKEVSSAPPAWTDLGSLGEQSGSDLRWFARHVIVTHGSCTFFSQSCLDLLRVLGTLMVLAKVANTSFLLFSIPQKHHMRGHTASYQEPTAAAPRFLDETRHTHQQLRTPLGNRHSIYRGRRLPTTTTTALVATARRHRRRRRACDTGPRMAARGWHTPGLPQRRPLPRRWRRQPERRQRRQRQEQQGGGGRGGNGGSGGVTPTTTAAAARATTGAVATGRRCSGG